MYDPLDEEFLICVKNGKRSSTYSKRNYLKSGMYEYNPVKKDWEKRITKAHLTEEKRFIRSLGLSGRYLSVDNLRSPECRKRYFYTHRPDRKGRYRCVYCGKKLKREDVCVDHVIPVKHASESELTRSFLHMIGMKNVNDSKNLVASCNACNSKKGSKIGIWPIRAFLGARKCFWPLMYSTIWFIILVLILDAVSSAGLI